MYQHLCSCYIEETHGYVLKKIANQKLHIANQIGNWLAICANHFFHNKLFTEVSKPNVLMDINLSCQQTLWVIHTGQEMNQLIQLYCVYHSVLMLCTDSWSDRVVIIGCLQGLR